MLGLDLAEGHLFILGSLHGPELVLGEDVAGLRYMHLKGLQTFLETLQVMAKPYAADSGSRHEDAPSPELVTHPLLAQGRVLESEVQDRCLDIFRKCGS